jgi:hypothetical protein
MPSLKGRFVDLSPRGSFTTWLDRKPCPPAGEGVHDWIKRAVGTAKVMGVKAADVEELVEPRLTRPQQPREIANIVAYVYGQSVDSAPSVKRVVASYSEDLLRRRAELVPAEVNREWLKTNSPIMSKHPAQLLHASYLPEMDAVTIVTNEGSWKRLVHVWNSTEPDDSLAYLTTGQQGGVFFAANPVRPDATSWSQENVTRWPYIVIESDKAPEDLWISSLFKFRTCKRSIRPVVSRFTP